MKNYPEELKLFSRILRLKRHENNLTQEKLAEIVDCHTNAIGRLERSESYPNFKMIIGLANALGISPKDLMPY